MLMWKIVRDKIVHIHNCCLQIVSKNHLVHKIMMPKNQIILNIKEL